MALNKDFKVKNGATITQDLSVGGNAYLNALTGTSATFTNLTSTSATFVNTIVTSTSALSVINNGTGPALYVRQKGSNQPIAEFVDQEGGVIYFADTGNLGINTTAPNEKLTVSGNISATKSIEGLSLSATSTNGGFVSAGRDLADIFATTASSGSVCGSGTTGRITKWSGSTTLTNSLARENSTQLTVDGSLSSTGSLSASGSGYNYLEGRLGINTNRPDYMLDVAGSVGIGACLIHNGDDDTFIHFTDDDINIQAGGVNFIDITQDTTNEITFNEAGADVDFRAEGSSDTHLLFVEAGTNRVGIGTDAPDYKLDVAGSIGMNEYLYHNGDGDTYLRFAPNTVNLVAGGKSALKYEASTGKIRLNNTNADVDVHIMADDGTEILATDAANNRVGINTTTPNEALTVAGSISACNTVQACSVSATKSIEGLSLSATSTNGGIVSAGRDLADIFVTASGNVDGSGTANFLPSWSDSNTLADSLLSGGSAMTRTTGSLSATTNMLVGGNIGVGTCAPNEKLTVAGNISATGNLYLDEDQRIFFERDNATWIETDSADRLRFVAGGKQMLLLDQDTGDRAVFGFGTKVGINIGNNSLPNEELTVSGNISATGNLSANGATITGDVSATSNITGNIVNVGTRVKATGSSLEFSGNGLDFVDGSSTSYLFRGIAAGAFEGYYSGVKRFETTSTGSKTSGSICATNDLNVDGDATVRAATVNRGLTAHRGLSARSTHRGFVSAGRDLADIFATSAGNVDGSGTANFLPVWSDANTIGNSIVCQPACNLITVKGNLSACGGLSATEMNSYFGCSVGVGVTTPNAKLHVSNSGAPTFRLSRTGTGQIWEQSIDSSGRFGLREAASEGGTQYARLEIDDAGDTCLAHNGGCVGIGTCAPTSKLFIKDAEPVITLSNDNTCAFGIEFLNGTTFDACIKQTPSSGEFEFNVGRNATWGGDFKFVVDTYDAYKIDRDLHRFYTGGSERMRINSDGNVGIKGGDPGQRLTVGGNISACGGLSATEGVGYFACNVGIGTNEPSELLHVQGNNATVNVRESGAATVKMRAGSVGRIGTYSNDDFSIVSNSMDQVRIKSDGKVGIGNTAPGEKLTVSGNISACGGLSATESNNYFECSVSIGTNIPSQELTVKGELATQNSSGIQTVIVGNASDDGVICINDGGGNTRTIIHSDANSYISQCNFGIGNTAPNEKLTVAGNISATGTLSADGAIRVPDSTCITLGNSEDLQIYHNGSNSVIKDNGTGGLFLLADAATYIQSTLGESMGKFTKDSSVELYYDNSKKFETDYSGVCITGGLSACNTRNGIVSAGRDLADIFATSAGNVDGSGTKFQIPQWNDIDTLGDSPLSATNSGASITRCDDVSTLTLHRDGSNPGTNTVLSRIKFDQDYGGTQQNWAKIDLCSNDSSTRTDMDFYVKSVSGALCRALTLHGGSSNEGTSVGIGASVTDPGPKLTVGGNLSACGGLSATEGVGYFACNVGIGTNRPGSILELQGDGGNNKQLRLASGSSAVYWDIGRNYNTGHFEITEDSGSTYFLIDKDNGNVGIGATAPNEKLTVAGNISACGGLSATKGVGYFACKVGIGTNRPETSLDICSNIDQQTFCIQGANSSIQPVARIRTISTGSVLLLETATTSDSRDIIKAKNSSGTVLNLQADGKLGIGTEVPNEALTVAGNISACNTVQACSISANSTNGGFVSAGRDLADIFATSSGNVDGTGTKFKIPQWTDTDTLGDSAISAIDNGIYIDGCAGIGTSTPNHTLDVEESGASMRLRNTATDATTQFIMRSGGSAGQNQIIFGDDDDANIGMIRYRHNGDSLAFDVSDSEAMRILSDGNVGIGETVPGEKLTVAGNISALGHICTTCCNVQGKIVRGTSCVVAAKVDAQYISNIGEVCLTSGCYGCIRLGSSLGTKGVVISANNANEAKVAIGVNSQVGFSDNDAALTVNGSISANNTVQACSVSANSTNGGFVSAGRDLADIFTACTGTIDGSGTTCHVPEFTDADTIGSSSAYFNSSTLVNRGLISGSNICIGGDVPTNAVIGQSRIGNYVADNAYFSHFDNGTSANYAVKQNANGATGLNSKSGQILTLNINNDPQLTVNADCVGIGTTGPAQKLHLEFANTDTSFSGGGGGAWGGEGLLIENTSSNTDTMAMIQLRTGDADIHIAGIRQGTDDNDLGLFFEASEKVRFTHDGDVGIGTTAPNEKLTVAGNISADGNMYITANDPFIYMTDDSGSTYNAAWKFQNNCQFWEWGGGKKIYFDSGSGIRLGDWGAGTGTLATTRDPRIGKCGSTFGGLCFTTGNSTRMVIQSAGNVGIGTDSPNEKLTVAGNLSATGTLSAERVAVCNSSYGGFISGGRDLADIFATTSGNVDGSGTKFKIPQWNDTDTLGDSPLSATNNGVGVAGSIIACATDPRIRVEATAGNHPGFEWLEASNRKWLTFNDPANDHMTWKNASDTEVMELDQDGYLYVNSKIVHLGDTDTFIDFTDDDINIQAGGVNFIDITEGGTNEITFNEAGADVDFRVEGDTQANLLFTDASSDRVGIGTSCPDVLLTVQADNTTGPTIGLHNSEYCSWINAWGSCGPSGRASRFEINAGSTNFAVGADTIRFQIGDVGDSCEKMRIDTCGCVGIGTCTPQSLLHVSCGDIRIDNNCQYLAETASGGTIGVAKIDGSDNLYIGDCNIKIDVSGTTPRMTIGTDSCGCGFVGIGNDNTGCVLTPNERLTVGGAVSATGNGYFACVIAGGYFEQKAANDTLACYPTGTLVVIGECGDLIQSTRENDKKVFGVTQNGVCQPIVLGAEPVLVTGDIKIGDYITTSDKPGHGRKTLDPIYGSVIAQSMEAGTGDSHLVKAMIRKM